MEAVVTDSPERAPDPVPPPLLLPPEGGTFPIDGLGIVRASGEPVGGTVTFTPIDPPPGMRVSMSLVTDSPDRSAEEDAEDVRREQEWLLARLREIPADRARLEERERGLAHGARAAGMGWDKIGEALGMTAEATRVKFGEPPPGRVPF